MKYRVATYLGLTAVVIVIIFIFHIADIFPSRFIGRWQPDEGDTQGYMMELTADSLITTSGPGHSVLVFTADTLESRMMAISVGATRLSSSSRLFDAAWDYAWYRLMMTDRPDLESVFLTLPCIPSGVSPTEEVLRNAAHHASPDNLWPLGNLWSLLRVTAAADFALSTGNEAFAKDALKEALAALTADSIRLYDQSTGLWRGGGDGVFSGTLPSWFTEADRFNLMSLSLNVAAADAYIKVAAMSRMTGDHNLSQRLQADGEQLAAGVRRRLWLPVEGRFSQYLYGRVAKIASPASTGLGNALAASSPAITDREMAHRIVDRLPRTPYGVLSTYPVSKTATSIEDTALAQSLWAAGCRRGEDYRALWNALASLLRLVCLDASGTDRTLAGEEACASFIGAVVHSIIGMRAEGDALVLNPYIPMELGSELRVTGLTYRDAILDIAVFGNGNSIASMTIDGSSQPDHRIPGSLTGRHKVRIEMVAPTQDTVDDRPEESGAVTMPEMLPDELKIDSVADNIASLHGVTESVAMIVNGRRMENFAGSDVSLPKTRGYREILFFPVDGSGRIGGLSSKPLSDYSPGSSITVQAEWFKARELARDIYRRMYRSWLRQQSRGKADNDRRPNRRLTQIVALPEDEALSFMVESNNATDCVIEVGYTQGRDSGPRGTSLRAVAVNGFHHTVLAMPRTIQGGDTTLTVTTLPTLVKLHEGTNEITLHTRQSERKPGARPDTVMIDFLRITPL